MLQDDISTGAKIAARASKRKVLGATAILASGQKFLEGFNPEWIEQVGASVTTLITSITGAGGAFLADMNTIYTAVLAWAVTLMRGHTEDEAVLPKPK